MTELLALTVTGPDRPGLIELLSTTLATHGANWQESRMARLAGQFAGVLLASIPANRFDALQTALQGLNEQGLTVVLAKRTAEQTKAERRQVKLELVGQDHPGIVREISHALAQRGVSIDEIETRCHSASWSGEIMFEASVELSAPPKLSMDQLREILEGLANELMVDITLEEGPKS